MARSVNLRVIKVLSKLHRLTHNHGAETLGLKTLLEHFVQNRVFERKVRLFATKAQLQEISV